jgi:Protein of Unknown function (DUF2784)
MAFRILADATVVFHIAFVLFVVLGGALVVRWPRMAWLHVPAVAWGVWVVFARRVCPLTPLENWFRRHAGGPTYTETFIDHYLVPLLYPSLSREIQYVLSALVLVINTLVYVIVVRRRAGK